MQHEAPIQGQDILTMVLVALGVSSTGVEFLGGLALGMAGALLASRIVASGMISGARGLGLFGSIVAGLFSSIIFALVAQWAVPDMPPQLPMAAGGFLSTLIPPFVLRIFARFTVRADNVADRVINRVLPDDDKDQ